MDKPLIYGRRSLVVGQLRALRLDAKLRQQQGLVPLFGAKLVQEYLKSQKPYQTIYRTLSMPPLSEFDKVIDAAAFQWACGVEVAEGYALLALKPPNYPPKPGSYALVLDGLQDPGNVGTLIRTALAFSFNHVICIAPCCDPFNDKVLRASAGAAFHIPLWQCGEEAFLSHLKEQDILPWAALAHGGIHPTSLPQSAKERWLIIGHEGQGIRPSIQACSQPMTLPMRPEVESLNAAVAGSILAYLCRP